MADHLPAPPRVRLDIWLDVACLFKTRSEAQRACNGGKVDVNSQRAKPHREIQPGDEISITRPMGRKQKIVVLGLAERHLPKAQARHLYRDDTPPPSSEEIELRRLTRLAPAVFRSATRAPSKRERRELRRIKGRE